MASSTPPDSDEGEILPAANGSSSSSPKPRRRSAAAKPDPDRAPGGQDRRDDAMSGVGAGLRERRQAQGISLRQFARDLGVSPSFLSQIENGKSRPSVATLYMICSKLSVSVDELFAKTDVMDSDPGQVPADSTPAPREQRPPASVPQSRREALTRLNTPDTPPAAGLVVTPGQRRRLVLDSGVTWEQLSPTHDASVDFLFVRYDVGGSSVAHHELTRHAGFEYGYVISGTLEIALGFATYQVKAGESIAFDSSTPHRLTNTGDVPVEAIWFVHGRNSSYEH
jgi:transcriptional regulator with XRE-family HTH domain/quercetin dioxygenase-like cupin family protein